MAELNFTKLADAPILESVPDGAKVYAEVDGKVYRVAGDNLGGGVKTAVFKVVQEDQTEPMSLREAGVATASAGDNARDSINYFYTTCENMTFEEAKALLLAGKPLAAGISLVKVSGGVMVGCVFGMQAGVGLEGIDDGVPIIVYNSNEIYCWHPDGTFTNDPDYDQPEPQ